MYGKLQLKKLLFFQPLVLLIVDVQWGGRWGRSPSRQHKVTLTPSKWWEVTKFSRLFWGEEEEVRQRDNVTHKGHSTQPRGQFLLLTRRKALAYGTHYLIDTPHMLRPCQAHGRERVCRRLPRTTMTTTTMTRTWLHKAIQASPRSA